MEASMIRSLKAVVPALLLMGIVTTAIPAGAVAQATAKKKVASDADLPRYSYPVTGTASDLLLSDDATFDPFTRKVGADVDATLANYEIEDKATLRKLLGAKLDVQMLSGDRQGALATLGELKDLQEKPDAKVMSGLLSRAILQAWSDAGTESGAAYEQAFAKHFAEAVNALPWTVVQDRVKSMKGSCQIMSLDFLV